MALRRGLVLAGGTQTDSNLAQEHEVFRGQEWLRFDDVAGSHDSRLPGSVLHDYATVWRTSDKSSGAAEATVRYFLSECHVILPINAMRDL